MGFTYNGDAVLGVSLTVETPKPLDSRSVVDSIQELYTIPEKIAYEGMTVANKANGNIYMLIDKNSIGDKSGWKASYESIQIIACTEAEYKEWSANTTEDFKPIEGDKPFLHEDTYYYIYEDSLSPETEDQEYLSASWGRQIEEQLKQRALNTTVLALQQKVEQDIENLNSNYYTSEYINENFALLESLNVENPESTLSKALSNYYTKSETDEIFVTKESLKGEGMEGDDFIFVTKNQYDEDQALIKEELDKTLKVDGNGQLESITVGTIKSPKEESSEEQLIVNVKPDGLYIEEDKLATISQIPNLVTLTEEEYLRLEEEGSLEEDTYYYVYDVENDAKVYITKEYLDLNYHTKNQYQMWVSSNYYSKSQVDEIVSGLQKLGDYVTKEEIKAYSTKEELAQLSNKIEEEYVTKESLRGDSPETGEDDFIFVTQKKYNEDKEAQAIEFETQTLITDSTKTSSIIVQKIEEKEIPQEEGEPIIQEEVVSQNIITTENNKLLIDNKQVAFDEDVPKIVCLPQNEYDDMVQQGETKEDTYYYTYNKEQGVDTGYVTPEYLKQSYYTKQQVEELIRQSQTIPKMEFIEIKLNSQDGTVLEQFLVCNKLFTVEDELFKIDSQKEKIEEEILVFEDVVKVNEEILII